MSQSFKKALLYLKRKGHIVLNKFICFYMNRIRLNSTFYFLNLFERIYII